MISKSFELREAVFSDTAFRLSIDNTPVEKYVQDAISYHAIHTLEPLVEAFGKVTIVSWYRCAELEYVLCQNAYMKWCAERRLPVCAPTWASYLARKSHPRGEATDILIPGVHPQDIYNFILSSDIEFDQLILEYADQNNDGWIHISSVDESIGKINRKQAFKVL